MKSFLKTNLSLILIACFSIACSSKYSIKTVVREGSALSKFKTRGVLFRIPDNNYIALERFYTSLDAWIKSSHISGSIVSLPSVAGQIAYFKSESERFYQFSNEDESFLKYKSLGMISLWCRDNNAELTRLFAENKLDCLVIYEIESALSIEMQYIDFDSIIAIVDRDFNVSFLDYQKNGFEIRDIDSDLAEKHLLDKISERFLEKMEDLKYLKR